MNDVLDASVPKLDKLGQLYYDTSGAIDKTNKGLKTNAKKLKMQRMLQRKLLKSRKACSRIREDQ